MLGPRWNPPTVEQYLRRRGVAPLVRSTRSQLEIDYLPPYGDPEVSIPGEAATYVAIGATAVEVLHRLGD
jgi:hypothetical protein